ncbi:MAG: PEP-CTERM sorting domain-containing protein [Pseudomonadota bacterium]|nr:PEP-CTERM sorting domain-containing protein [Pseudomonadota bacterium]
MAPSLQFWETGQGVSQNARPSTNAINTTGGNAGFNTFFTSAFAVLGDDAGAIGGAPDAGRSLIFQGFTLNPIVNVGGQQRLARNFDLTITFFTAFDGDDNGTKDRFTATLGNITLFTQDSDPFPDGGPAAGQPNNQATNNPFSTTIRGLDPGNYTFGFELVEAPGAATNTAAGIDMVSIMGEANLAPVPEPTTLSLLGVASLIGFGWRRRAAAARVQGG